MVSIFILLIKFLISEVLVHKLSDFILGSPACNWWDGSLNTASALSSFLISMPFTSSERLIEMVCVVGFMKYAFTSMLKALFSSFLIIVRKS